MSYCKGCGVELSLNKDSKGFTPLAIEETQYCQRCHKLKHYNKLEDHGLDNDFYIEQLKKITEKKALFVYVLDIMDIKSSNVCEIFNLIKNKPYVVLLNRMDLLPLQKNEKKILQHCIKEMKNNDVKPIDFLPVSAIKNRNIDQAIEMIKEYSRGKEIIFVGTSNIGKSSLIRSIINTIADKKSEPLISNFPGTTLACIKHQPQSHFSVWDTPGIINSGVVSSHFNKKLISKIKNTKEIKPVTYQLNPDQTMYFGGLAKFRFIDGIKSGFAFVMPPSLKIHRTKTVEECRIDARLIENNLVPIINGKKKKHRFKLTGTKKIMIVIGGLGFIATKPKGQIVEVETGDKICVYITESIL